MFGVKQVQATDLAEIAPRHPTTLLQFKSIRKEGRSCKLMQAAWAAVKTNA